MNVEFYCIDKNFVYCFYVGIVIFMLFYLYQINSVIQPFKFYTINLIQLYWNHWNLSGTSSASCRRQVAMMQSAGAECKQVCRTTFNQTEH